jgi:hypothetical protein
VEIAVECLDWNCPPTHARPLHAGTVLAGDGGPDGMVARCWGRAGPARRAAGPAWGRAG